MKVPFYLIIGVTLLAPLACQKQQIDTYRGGKTLVIVSEGAERELSAVFSENLGKDTISIPVPIWLLGAGPTDTDIPYWLSVTGIEQTVFWGKRNSPGYELDSVFHAGPKPDTLLLHILRTPQWTDTTYRFTLVLETEEAYAVPIKNTHAYFTEVHITLVDEFSKPTWWAGPVEQALGPFSSRKMRAIFRWLEWETILWDKNIYEAVGSTFENASDYIAQGFALYLAAQAAHGKPVLERDGTPVSVPYPINKDDE